MSFFLIVDDSGNSEGAWRLDLQLHDDEQMIPSSSLNQYTSNKHQVYVLISDTSEEFDAKNNSVIDPHNIERGANHRAEGETDSAIATREKVHLSVAEWKMIKAALNHNAAIPADSTREILMGTSMPCISKGNNCCGKKVR
jgi:hypothetical protein